MFGKHQELAHVRRSGPGGPGKAVADLTVRDPERVNQEVNRSLLCDTVQESGNTDPHIQIR